MEGRALNNERFHAIIGEMADNIYLEPSLSRLLGVNCLGDSHDNFAEKNNSFFVDHQGRSL